VPRPALVIREVDQLARRAKWRACDLAEALGVSVSMLNRLRAGTSAPSREVLGAMLRAFGGNLHVRELVLHFLEHELAIERAATLDAAPIASTREEPSLPFGARTRTELRAFVAHFLRKNLLSGRGLCITAADDAALRAATGYVRAALDAQGIPPVVLAAQAPLAGSHRASALAAPLVIAERVEFASKPVRAVLRERAAVRKPVLLTSLRPLADDTDLAPVLRTTTTLALHASSPPTPPPHA